MSALRSVLIEALRELPDAELARIVRAATNEQLRPLVQVALDLDDAQETEAEEEAQAEETPAPRRRARQAAQEAPRGSRPSPAGERLLAQLKRGAKTTSQLSEALAVSPSAIRQTVARLVEIGAVTSTRQPGRGGEFEVALT